MASWGQGAAQGIEAGMGLAMRLHQQQRSEARQDAQDTRQAGLDQQAQEDHTRGVTRQKDADAMTAVTAQRAAIKDELQTHKDANTEPPPELLERAKGVDEMHQQQLTKMGGYDPNVVARNAEAGVQALKNKDMGFFQKNPGVLSQTVLKGTGYTLDDYRKDGPVVKGIVDLQTGMESGDQDRTLNGANVILKKELSVNNGKPGREGGTIVGTRIIHLVPTPNSPEDDPHFVPTVRVYVNNGKQEASGDEIRARRSMDPDAPPGATGHYDSFITKKRGTDPNDPDDGPLPISMKAAMDKVAQHMELANMVNSPDASGILEHERDSGWDGKRYEEINSRYGVKEAKPVSSSFTLKPNEKRFTDTTVKGVTTRTVEEGNKKASSLDATIEQIDELDIPDAEKVRLHKAAVTYAATKLKGGGLSSGSKGDGEGGGEGLSKAEKRMYDVGNKALENRSTTLDRKEQRERDDYKNDLDEVKPDPLGDLPKVTAEKAKRRAEIRATHQKTVATHDAEREEIKAARQTLEANSQGEPPPKPGLATPAKATPGKLTKDAAAAKFGF